MSTVSAPLTDAELDALRRITSPSICNGIETFNVRDRSEGFMRSDIVCRFPDLAPMVGYAATARIRSIERPGPEAMAKRRALWEHILSIPAPRVVVIQDMDDHPLGSFWGEVQANIHRALGCIGTVTNGGVRDLDEVRALDFHFFSAQIQVSHAWVHVVEVGTPVEVGGLTVRPGDLLHGDKHGVTSIPLEVARDLPRAVAEVEARERRIIALAQSPDFTLDALLELYAGRR